MNSFHAAAAVVELPVIQDEFGAGPSSPRPGKSLSTSPTLGVSGDIELMDLPSVVGREAGERDPLLLRSKIMSDETIEGIKQCVLRFFLSVVRHLQSVQPLSSHTLRPQPKEGEKDCKFLRSTEWPYPGYAHATLHALG